MEDRQIKVGNRGYKNHRKTLTEYIQEKAVTLSTISGQVVAKKECNEKREVEPTVLERLIKES